MAGVNVPLGSTWNPKGIKQAQADLAGFKKHADSSLKRVAIGFGIAGAAAAAFAVKVGVDAVQAAMDDQQSVASLAKTLGNLGLAYEQASAEEFIDDLQFQSMFVDTELRPAFAALIGVTKDYTDAQVLLQLAMDVSAGTGKDLASVTAGIAKAAGGQTGALRRLVPGLTAAEVKSDDLLTSTGALSRLFGGQAQAATQTLSGKMKLLRTGVDELQESFGYGLMEGFFDALSDGTGDAEAVTRALRNQQGQVNVWGKAIGSVVPAVIDWFNKFGLVAIKTADVWDDTWAAFERLQINAQDFWGEISDEEAEAARKALDAADAQRDAAMMAYVLESAGQGAADGLDATGDAASRASSQLDNYKTEADRATNALDRLKKQMDKFDDRRSIMRQRIDLRRMLAEGPQGTGKKGAVTADDRRLFALDVADARARLAESLLEQGGKGAKRRARNQFALGREDIRDLGFSPGFARNILGTPNAVKPTPSLPFTDESQKLAFQPTYNITVTVPPGATLDQIIKEAERLAASSNGRFTGPTGRYGRNGAR